MYPSEVGPSGRRCLLTYDTSGNRSLRGNRGSKHNLERTARPSRFVVPEEDIDEARNQPAANPARQKAHMPLHQVAVDQLIFFPVGHRQQVFRRISLFRTVLMTASRMSESFDRRGPIRLNYSMRPSMAEMPPVLNSCFWASR